MRLFFALLPDPTARERLYRRAVAVQRQCGGRLLPAASLHLTLAFLGDLPEQHVATLVRLTGADPIRSGTLTFAHLSAFPRRRIVWAGVGDGRFLMRPAADVLAGSEAPANNDGLDELITLQSALLTRLAEAGVAPRPESFRPHVSLVRNAVSSDLRRTSLPPVAWRYDSLVLLASEPTGGRHRYVELARSPVDD